MPPLDQSRAAIVYRMTSTNGKKYIGLTSIGLTERMYAHKASAKGSGTSALHSAIKKHGFTNFVVEQLFSGTFAECIEIEKSTIILENTKVPFGYNIAAGGEGSPGVVQSAETIAKRAAANTGKKRSAAFCVRLGNIKRGRKVSEETRQRQHIAGVRRAANPIERARLLSIGTKPSLETREKMRRSHVGQKASPQTLAKMREVQSSRQSCPELRARMAETIRSVWAKRKQSGEENASA